VIVVPQPRIFPYRDPKFWDSYRKTPAWEFARFEALVAKGKPHPNPPPVSKEGTAAREREDFEASMRYTQELLKRLAWGRKGNLVEARSQRKDVYWPNLGGLTICSHDVPFCRRALPRWRSASSPRRPVRSSPTRSSNR